MIPRLRFLTGEKDGWCICLPFYDPMTLPTVFANGVAGIDIDGFTWTIEVEDVRWQSSS
jgi:hypothetical protein